MFQTVANKLGHGLFMVQNNKFIWVNKSFAEIFDYQQDEILLKNYSELIYSENLPEFEQLVSQIQSSGIDHFEMELRGVKKNGSLVDISLGIKFVEFEDQQATIGSVMDISHRKRMELELKQSESRYQNIVENAPVGILVHQKGIIQYVNTMAANLLMAKTTKELIGQSINLIIHKQYEDVVSERILNIQNLGVTAKPIYQRVMRLDGTEIDVETSGMPIQLNGEPAIESIFWDATEKKREEEIIRFRAYYDTLTDLPNLQKFQIDFEEEFNNDTKLTILYLSIDELKEIIEKYGRKAGELVLVKVGGRLSGAMVQSGLLYRMDGDRFSIVLQGEVQDNELQGVVEKIRSLVSQPLYITNTTVSISINMGVVYYPQDGGEYNLILQHADLALNHAKKTKSLYKKYDG